MAYRDFHIPDPRSNAARSRTEDGAARFLVGGSREMRRRHGTPSPIEGRWIRDPIFRAEHLSELRAFCAADDPRPLIVEIGFQQGRFASAFCAAHPKVRYLGFEVRRKWCEITSERFDRFGIHNGLLALVDARQMLPDLLAPDPDEPSARGVDLLLAFFPDPWWKRKHAKKRLVSEDFAEQALRMLRPGGVFVVKTDVEGYARWAFEALQAVATRTGGGWQVERLAAADAGLPLTLRERRCAYHGRPTWAMAARKALNTPDEQGDCTARVDNLDLDLRAGAWAETATPESSEPTRTCTETS